MLSVVNHMYFQSDYIKTSKITCTNTDIFITNTDNEEERGKHCSVTYIIDLADKNDNPAISNMVSGTLVCHQNGKISDLSALPLEVQESYSSTHFCQLDG